jgi:hypothetical protein
MGKGNEPKQGTELAVVGDANEFVCGGRDDFLSGQGGTSTLDHVAGLIDFICAIDIDIETGRSIEI